MRALVLALLASTASAGEIGDRTELMARIDDKVHAVATALDAHKYDDANARLHELRDMLTRLASTKGTDARAADISAHYPSYADATETAIKRVIDLEQKLHRTDGVAARCAKDDAELHKLLLKRTQHPDADPNKDIDALVAKSDAYGAAWTPVLADLATIDHGHAGEVAAAKLGLTDGYWMAVSTTITTAASEAGDAWTDPYEAVTTACSPLAAGQKHADIAPVVEALRGKIKSDVSAATQLVHDYNAWLATVRTLRELALQSRKSLRDTICETKDGEISSPVGTVATNWARDLGDRTSSAADEAARLKKAPRSSRVITDGLKAGSAIIATIARDEAQGRSNPKLVTALSAITKRRDKNLAANKCAASAIDLDCAGTACRASCVKITEHVCTIVEPIPDHADAKAAGFSRAQHELDALQAWYTRDKAGLFARVPALKRCEIAARSTLDLSTDVVSYATCSALTEAELGEPLAEIPADLE